MNKQEMINILMEDRYSKKEAENRLKIGVIIYEDLKNFLDDANQFKEDDEELITIEDVRAGHVMDMSAVTHNGIEYYIMYIN